VSDDDGGTDAIHVFSVSDGSLVRAVGDSGASPLQFSRSRQVFIAADDFLFVADHGNDRVLDFHSFVGEGVLRGPAGVCANDDVIVVSEPVVHRMSVFDRADGCLRRRFGDFGRLHGQILHPRGVCFTRDSVHIAVAEHSNDRVSVFSVDGEFMQHVGVRVLKRPHGVACSAAGELAVADHGNARVVLFGADGGVLAAFGRGAFTGVAMHDGMVYALDYDSETCALFVG
jgi:DNA-binding beta-propeller fold protein YncE